MHNTGKIKQKMGKIKNMKEGAKRFGADRGQCSGGGGGGFGGVDGGQEKIRLMV